MDLFISMRTWTFNPSSRFVDVRLPQQATFCFPHHVFTCPVVTSVAAATDEFKGPQTQTGPCHPEGEEPSYVAHPVSNTSVCWFQLIPTHSLIAVAVFVVITQARGCLVWSVLQLPIGPALRSICTATAAHQWAGPSHSLLCPSTTLAALTAR